MGKTIKFKKDGVWRYFTRETKQDYIDRLTKQLTPPSKSRKKAKK